MDDINSTKETHPSFAQISASRVNSSENASMYGSKLKHSKYIMLTIFESNKYRSIHQDRYMDDKQIIQVRLRERLK